MFRHRALSIEVSVSGSLNRAGIRSDGDFCITFALAFPFVGDVMWHLGDRLSPRFDLPPAARAFRTSPTPAIARFLSVDTKLNLRVSTLFIDRNQVDLVMVANRRVSSFPTSLD
jgi:hypothetical protein